MLDRYEIKEILKKVRKLDMVNIVTEEGRHAHIKINKYGYFGHDQNGLFEEKDVDKVARRIEAIKPISCEIIDTTNM
jgi:hypothetical protein